MKGLTNFFLIAVLSALCTFGYCQDVKVNINNQEASVKKDCPFSINGICITEDVGGVDVEFRDGKMILTNYNNFPVTVVWQITYHESSCCTSLDGTTKKGNVVLGVNAQKEILTHERCCDNGWAVDGIIARKIAQ